MSEYPLSLLDYFKVYENVIPKDLLSELHKFAKRKEIWTTHQFSNYDNKTFYDKEDCDISYIFVHELELAENLNKVIWDTLKTYTEHIQTFNQYCHYWNGFTGVRLNRYNKDHNMKKHVDHITTMFDGQRRGIPVLSVVGGINDNYKGGEFVFFDNHEVKIPAGSILIFPSVFLYPHTVKFVTKGTRYSFVSWTW